jgi:transcriptional regulator
MYVPQAFTQPDKNALQQLMRDHPFAALIVQTEKGMDANHLPFVWRDDGSEFGVLAGHVARTNPVWQTYQQSHDALAIFQAANAYITPSWYPGKQENGKVVPTWNYAVVHASGAINIIEDAQWLYRLLDELTNQHEKHFASPWAISDAPADFVEKLSGAIVGIEIPIRNLVGKWKLSQNQSEQNRQGVIQGLAASTKPQDREIAELMQRL